MRNSLLLVIGFSMLISVCHLHCENNPATVPIARAFLRYDHDFDSFDRYSGGFGVLLCSRVYTETNILGFTKCVDDPFNVGKGGNYSAIQLFLGVMTFPVKPVKSSQFNKYLLIPAMLTNTRYLLPLLKHNDESPSLQISAYVENTTDFFFYLPRKWFQFGPGIGLRVSFGYEALDFGVTAGYRYSCQVDLHGDHKDKGMLVLGFGWDSCYF